MATNHHDTGYKELFSYPEFVQQLIEGFAPADIAGLMDFSTLTNHSGNYITPLFEEKFEDVVWSVEVTWEGGNAAGVPVHPAGVSVGGGFQHADSVDALRRLFLLRTAQK
ncbi:Rpn family recombination-promoting nuclease/putative transposase [Vreelandella massiliensis]|uniref:Rpn family recombination-promoting nuclease/putative transposase n=1 Tax=Vreelandella massiliensis TaxID=1816686 RepID=UPI002287694B|nr:Rpn family recombination-promoting nuclease/putative transposase [Halomonas massiliensis]